MECAYVEGFSLAVTLLLEAMSEKYFTPSPPISRNNLKHSLAVPPFYFVEIRGGGVFIFLG